MILLGNIGIWQVAIIVVVVLIIFGPSRLPALARSIGQSIREFKAGMKGQIEDDKSNDDKSGR